MSNKDQEERLLDLGRAERARSREGTLQALQKFAGELNSLFKSTCESVQTVIKTIDGAGEIHTRVLVGIGGGASSENSVTRTNFPSRKERADRLREIIADVRVIIETLERNQPPSPEFDLAKYVLLMRKSIPDRNVMEVVVRRPRRK
jgi:hypothetical protein